MREHNDNFNQTFLRTNNREPSDDEVNDHLEFWGKLDVVSWIILDKYFIAYHSSQKGVTLVETTDAIKYVWVDAEVVGTPSSLSTEAAIEVVGIVVGDPQDWSFFQGVGEEDMNLLDDYVVPLYECESTKIGL